MLTHTVLALVWISHASVAWAVPLFAMHIEPKCAS